MKTYLVCYDLNKPGQDYTDLIDAIKKYVWWHHLDSTWIIKTDQSVVEVRDFLARHIDNNDELLVIESTGVAAWQGFSDRGSTWLKDNLRPS